MTDRVGAGNHVALHKNMYLISIDYFCVVHRKFTNKCVSIWIPDSHKKIFSKILSVLRIPWQLVSGNVWSGASCCCPISQGLLINNDQDAAWFLQTPAAAAGRLLTSVPPWLLRWLMPLFHGRQNYYFVIDRDPAVIPLLLCKETDVETATQSNILIVVCCMFYILLIPPLLTTAPKH